MYWVKWLLGWLVMTVVVVEGNVVGKGVIPTRGEISATLHALGFRELSQESESAEDVTTTTTTTTTEAVTTTSGISPEEEMQVTSSETWTNESKTSLLDSVDLSPLRYGEMIANHTGEARSRRRPYIIPSTMELSEAELKTNRLYPPGRNYFQLEGENVTSCEYCLFSGEIFVVYPNPKNVRRVLTQCLLPGELFASRTISIVYAFYFHVHNCREMVALQKHISEDILFYHPFSIYKNLGRSLPIPGFLPKFDDVMNPIWREISRIARFPFHKALMGTFPRNFINAAAATSSG